MVLWLPLNDPVANPKSILKEYGMTTVDVPTDKFDAVVLGVSHDAFNFGFSAWQNH
jgi:hypothetical protein